MYVYVYIYIYIMYASLSLSMYIYIYIHMGRVLLTEILSARIARWRIVRLISTREQTRTARIEIFELDEGFQPYHHPF